MPFLFIILQCIGANDVLEYKRTKKMFKNKKRSKRMTGNGENKESWIGYKIGLLANLFSQKGDLLLDENDKAGLVSIFNEIINDLNAKE